MGTDWTSALCKISAIYKTLGFRRFYKNKWIQKEKCISEIWFLYDYSRIAYLDYDNGTIFLKIIKNLYKNSTFVKKIKIYVKTDDLGKIKDKKISYFLIVELSYSLVRPKTPDDYRLLS